MNRKPARFIRFVQPEVSHDGKNIAVKIETNGPTFDVEIPASEIGAVMQFLASAAEHLNDGIEPSKRQFSPVPLHGIGLAMGRSPSETLLVVHMKGGDLAFSLDSSKVASLGDDFARIARVLAYRNDLPM